jgi:hypothetical protein
MMHHGMPLQQLSSRDMQRTSMGAARVLFCRILMEACEAREHGSDSKQSNQVGGSIMQAKEWTRAFGRCNPVEHAVTKQQASMESPSLLGAWKKKGSSSSKPS